MTVSLTTTELKTGFAALTSLVAMVESGMITKASTEQVISDGFTIGEELFPAYAPALMAANFLIAIIIERNTQGQPGSQTPMPGGPPSSRIPSP